MSELGELLELLHGARRRYRTVRLEAREWRHYERVRLAYENAARRAGATVAGAVMSDVPAPVEGEARVRIWFEQPNCVREEHDDAERQTVVVADGERWWTHTPDWATILQDGDGWASGSAHVALQLLDPVALLSVAEFDFGGRTQHAGREALAVSLTDRPRRNDVTPGPLLWGADGHRLLVDAERGVLLSVTAYLDAEPMWTTEVLEIAFDQPLDPDLFRYDAPPGEEILGPHDVSPGEHVTIDEAARRAAFTVLTPASLERGWRMHVMHVPGRGRIRETVTISLYRDDASHSVSIRETSPPFERWQLNGTEAIERDGEELRVSPSGWRRALLERDGTCVEVNSETVEVDELVELALSLRPAPLERPRLLR